MTCADDDSSLEQKRPPPSMGQSIERISLSPLVVPRQESMSIRGLLNPQELPRAASSLSIRRQENEFKQEDGLPRMLSKRPLDLLDADAVCPKRGLSCNVPACPNKAVSKGRCITHGGGCRCKIPGCKNGAKMYGLCHLHGGRKQCKATGCNKFAKSMGLCWAHGSFCIRFTSMSLAFA
ncbi:hypothetical protein, variant [Saprolegnia diclina VS20]|uniref:WRKY19-like zinc finger domain-containing protein n=1 Tax=Saprolegnia diclina (strain VS20) TaxID=1156394 RepID=T0S3Z8_SAPDV|nr:hypothetical protein, variant [Saprolegnia diclina VS20]EQC39818.1 hypothetical protein, variant [Saprolegnia diclina VS20]|eukprot:XP_008607090.1 hypothetical protein, variant [Saprolegnia diclina VS20]